LQATPSDRLVKYQLLTTINRDFVHDAVGYARTIISEAIESRRTLLAHIRIHQDQDPPPLSQSRETVTAATHVLAEFFLHSKDKSLRPSPIGGVAGGQKFLWRGILFKLADGALGPWGGSDELAAKARAPALSALSQPNTNEARSRPDERGRESSSRPRDSSRRD